MKAKVQSLNKRWLYAFLSLLTYTAFGQNLTDSLKEDERQIITSIAAYPADVRTSILDVSQYAHLLVKLERTQARSSQSFQDLIGGYGREEQEKFYQLGRYPDLVNQLVAAGKLADGNLDKTLSSYPADFQAGTKEIYQNHFDDIVKMNTLYQSSQQTLGTLTEKLPTQAQQDFQKVVSMPDVMNLLTDNIDLTVNLGDDYKADPAGVARELDEMSSQLATQNEKDLAAYKQEVENNPQMQTEMKNAANDFAQTYDQPDGNPTYVTNNYYDTNPYPYWYGYPYWYPSPIWYPTPFYYNTGFYYGAGGRIVVMGMPSHAYSSWFFGRGFYNRYPSLYSHYNTYYNIHRNNIVNANVYRGFNNDVRNHFTRVNRTAPNSNPGRTPGRTGSTPNTGNQPNWRNAPNTNPAATFRRPAQYHTNQLNNPSGTRTQNFNHFNATTFHGAGWNNVGRGAGGARPMGGGGMRPAGGGPGGGRGRR